MADAPVNLPIKSMHERHYGLTAQISGYYEQAADVCLARHHNPPVRFVLFDTNREVSVLVTWTPPDDRALAGWNNDIDTTEAGAYACALAAVEVLREFFAVRRAETGTGSDYYIGPSGAGIDDLENCLRLEVSGVDLGDEAEIQRRLQRKIKQAQEGRSSLPAFASVVGFAAMQIHLAEVPEPS